jgi:hypothetical protein
LKITLFCIIVNCLFQEGVCPARFGNKSLMIAKQKKELGLLGCLYQKGRVTVSGNATIFLSLRLRGTPATAQNLRARELKICG